MVCHGSNTRALDRGSGLGLLTATGTLPAPPQTTTPSSQNMQDLRKGADGTCSSAVTSPGAAPYLLPSWQRAAGSSARRRSSARVRGCHAASLRSSDTVSKVVRPTPRAAAWRMSRGRLHALAYTMRPGGTPSASTRSTSASDAQSKPAPSTACARRDPSAQVRVRCADACGEAMQSRQATATMNQGGWQRPRRNASAID